MPATSGRPRIDDTKTVAMTIRVDEQAHAELTRLALECGIRSVNAYSAFMLLQHVNAVAQAKRHREIEASLG